MNKRRARRSGPTGGKSAAKRAFPSDPWVRAALVHWILALTAGPVLGYFITGITEWLDVGNWRMWMWIRLIACFFWPVGAALLFGMASKRHDPAWTWKATRAFVLFSSYGIYMALNAALDLVTGPKEFPCVVTDIRTHVGRSKGTAAVAHEVFLDGHSYYMKEVTAKLVGIGDNCQATVLSHTDLLLDLRPE